MKREANFACLLLSFIDMCPHDDEVREMNSQATDSHKILTLKMHVRNDGYVLSYPILLIRFKFDYNQEISEVKRGWGGANRQNKNLTHKKRQKKNKSQNKTKSS